MVPINKKLFVLMIGEVAFEVGQRVFLGLELDVVDPTALLDQLLRDAPILEFAFQTRAAHVKRDVQLAQSVVVEDGTEDFGVPVEEVFLLHLVEIQAGWAEAREASSCGRRRHARTLRVVLSLA